MTNALRDHAITRQLRRLLLGIFICAALIAAFIALRSFVEAQLQRRVDHFHAPAIALTSEMKAALAALAPPAGVADSYTSQLSSPAAFVSEVTSNLDRTIALGERLLELYRREGDPGFTNALLRLERALPALREIAQGRVGDPVGLARQAATSRPYLSIVVEQLLRAHQAEARRLGTEREQMRTLFSSGFLVLFLLLATFVTLLARHSFRDIGAVLLRDQATTDALRESEQRFRNFFQLGLVGMSITRPDKRWEQFNDHLCELLGYTREEMRQLTWAAVTHPEDVAADEDLYNRVLAGEIDSYMMDKRHIRKDGRIIYVTIAVRCERGANGAIERLFCLIIDVTDRRLAEQELARHRDNLEQLVEQRSRDLVAALDAAERASRAKTEFLSRMSHELRTPLNAILGFAQVLRLRSSSLTTADREKGVQQIETAGWHLLELINEVLDLSRIEAGKMLVSREPVQLQALCAECLRLTAPLAQAAKIVVIDRTRETPPLWSLADRTRLSQVLMNLLSNAIKYNRPRGSITVTLQDGGDDWVEIGVEDTGPGFTPEQMRGLYEPFNRLGADASRVEGTGIGLTLTKRLTELMGGTLELASNVGMGSRFTVRLARATNGAAVAAHIPDLPPDAADPKPSTPRTLLYIEDNSANVQVMRSAVGLRPGLQLLDVPDGRTALALVAGQAPDLILIDIALPGIDGYEVCRRLRARSDTATKPIIAVSANAMPADIERGKQAGFDAYLTKPFDVKRLLALIDEMLA